MPTDCEELGDLRQHHADSMRYADDVLRVFVEQTNRQRDNKDCFVRTLLLPRVKHVARRHPTPQH
jgi:hypothetical protein